MIRPGAPIDLEALEPLAERFREEVVGGPRIGAEGWRPWMLQRLVAGDVRVVVLDRRIVGYIAWRIRGRLEILEMFVAADERGQRVGSGLVARAVDAARQRGVDEIALMVGVDDPAVRAMFASLGFVARGDALVRALSVGGSSASGRAAR
jgi:GNAT superfamily N-acetyltransferase